ncbi:3'-5' exonuclease KapD [Metabacillus sp. GX 13764]|uniref:3'-5' exonuclease KapD n=1 Tax=Metabacillus kandeliae TaxID=2900151 RepID=UPI001E3DB99C|nr:3'-5' exonuclease KapD [Metabacillus kandeliae]MCD7035743.1 3'-5' exonuclease KapD [Metabacillus kandeliae]
MNTESPLIFVDFEFTMPEGKSLPQAFYPEIIEVGLITVQNGQIEHQYSSYVKPETHTILTERCKNFLGISQAQVDGGISFAELTEILHKSENGIPGKIVTWGNMDMRVLRMNCEKNGVPFPFSGQFLDLSMEYKKFFGDRNQTGLWKAVEEYGNKGTGKHHRALDDALTTYKIYNLVEKDKRYLAKPTPTTIGDRVDFSKVLNKFAT